MADLKIAEAKTLKWEGGYCNIPGDKGGETIFGIARNMHPDLKLWKDVDNYKEGLKPFDKRKAQGNLNKFLGGLSYHVTDEK